MESIKSFTLTETITKSASVKIFSQVEITFTSNKIGQMAKAISGRINRDKNAGCLLPLIQDGYI